MARFVIQGGTRLSGRVKVSGAKNSALPMIAASLLTDQKVILDNIPDVEDVRTMIELAEHLGSHIDFRQNSLSITTPTLSSVEAPYDIVCRMRASYYMLGALVARARKAAVAMPGGCAIGPRPVDLHIKGLTALGAKVLISDGYIRADARKLAGRKIDLQGPKGTSVGATINIMLAAAGASGKTQISPAAMEPEVVDVANFLKTLGVQVQGQGTHRITVTGRQPVDGQVRYSIIPDRIEAGTLAVAAAITRGSIFIEGCVSDHMTSVLEKLQEIGVEVVQSEQGIKINGNRRKRAT
ncbi:MAG: UDP-N-acetylglucosamine 1-carboxyvinyltransferase, partial [candidate division WOR-3 bacterium]